MKLIKAIFSGKGLPRRGEKGFTLVELLIVLAILAVLAAVVIPNITGMFGRGAEQSFDTDNETIQMAAATFYFDVHDNGVAPGHYYPTESFGAGTGEDVEETVLTPAEFADAYEVIYMGLLCKTPVDPASWTLDGNVGADEKGPYLNELPESCSTDNSANGTGTYTWAIGANGKVYGFHTNAGSNYVVGFGEAYP